MLEGTHTLQEKKLSLRKFVVSTRNGCKDGGEGKRGTLDQPFADCCANGSTITRHGERPDKVSGVVGVNQDEWRSRSSSNHVSDSAQCSGTGQWGNKKVAIRQLAECRVEFSVPERNVRDPFAGELRREGEARLNGTPLCGQGGECRREPSHRWVRWAGDEKDPHGGDDGILA